MSSSPLVLVVDDSLAERRHTRLVLESLGFNVLEAPGLGVAQRLLASQQPAAILMDVVMPDIDGFAATRRLQADPATAAIPIVMVTSKDRPIDRANALHCGAIDLVVKPATRRDLAVALSKTGLIRIKPADSTAAP